MTKHQMNRRPKIRGPRRPTSTDQIVAWADQYHERTGRWPNVKSGRRHLPLGEHWKLLDGSLRLGLRGLPKGSSLSKLLAQRRNVRSGRNLPSLTEAQILK